MSTLPLNETGGAGVISAGEGAPHVASDPTTVERLSGATVDGADAVVVDCPPPSVQQPQEHEAELVVWTDLTLHEVDVLKAAASNVAQQDILAQMFQLKDHETNLRSAVLLDLYFHTIQFAEDEGFGNDQISAFFSIVKKTFFVCIETPFGNLEQCYNYFKDLVVRHTVQRPPYSLDIFRPQQAKKLTDYVFDTLFRNFKLYKYCFTPKVRLDLTINYVGTLVTPPPVTSVLVERTEALEAEAPGEEGAADGDAEKTDAEPGEVAFQDLPPAQRELRRLIEAQLTGQLADLKINLETQIKAADDQIKEKLTEVEKQMGGAKRPASRGRRK